MTKIVNLIKRSNKFIVLADNNCPITYRTIGKALKTIDQFEQKGFELSTELSNVDFTESEWQLIQTRPV